MAPVASPTHSQSGASSRGSGPIDQAPSTMTTAGSCGCRTRIAARSDSHAATPRRADLPAVPLRLTGWRQLDVTAAPAEGDGRADLLAHCVFLVLAGHATTTTLLAAGVHLLLEHRTQLDELLARPVGWLAAVQELVRFISPTTLTGVTARSSISSPRPRMGCSPSGSTTSTPLPYVDAWRWTRCPPTGSPCSPSWPTSAAPVTAAIGRLAGLDRGVARRALQDLEVIGVVGSERIGDEPTGDSRDVRPTAWSLVGEEDALIRKVSAAPLHDLAERGANRARGLDYD